MYLLYAVKPVRTVAGAYVHGERVLSSALALAHFCCYTCAASKSMLRWCETLPTASTSTDPWRVTDIAQRQQPSCKTCKYKLAKAVRATQSKNRLSLPLTARRSSRSQGHDASQHRPRHIHLITLVPPTSVNHASLHGGGAPYGLLPATGQDVEHAQNCSKAVHPYNEALPIQAARPVIDTQHAATERARPFINFAYVICPAPRQNGSGKYSNTPHRPDSTGGAGGADPHPRLPLDLAQRNDGPGHLISRAPGRWALAPAAAPQAPACL